MITGFDHFIIVVDDLNSASETFRRLGFQVNAGGEHPLFGSHNALAPLGDGTYLELVAFKNPQMAASTFWGDAVRKLTVRQGWGGYVLASNAISDDVGQIRKNSLEIGDSQPGTRTRPDGQQVAWRTAVVGGTPAGIFPFLIQDDTPRDLRAAPAQQGLGSQAHPREVIVAVKNIELARQGYRELLGIEPRYVHNTTGDLEGYRVAAPWGSIILAHPERKANAMSDQLAERGEGLYAVTLAVENVNRARSAIVQAGIGVEDDPSGFLIKPDAACGARIRLAQA